MGQYFLYDNGIYYDEYDDGEITRVGEISGNTIELDDDYLPSEGSAQMVYTNEEIEVGSWVDGRTIYQRSWFLDPIDEDSDLSSTVTSLLDDYPIDFVIDYEGVTVSKSNVNQHKCLMPTNISWDYSTNTVSLTALSTQNIISFTVRYVKEN